MAVLLELTYHGKQYINDPRLAYLTGTKRIHRSLRQIGLDALRLNGGNYFSHLFYLCPLKNDRCHTYKKEKGGEKKRNR